jgi:hypothetical protein
VKKPRKKRVYIARLCLYGLTDANKGQLLEITRWLIEKAKQIKKAKPGEYSNMFTAKLHFRKK